MSDVGPPPRALTVAGSDPSGGAGLQADVAVFARLGVHPMAVPAALTVQNSTGVIAYEPVDPELVEAQLKALLTDMPPAAIKTGMLATAPVVRAVARALEEVPDVPLVVDPLFAASAGRMLLTDDGFDALAETLVPRAALLIPNRYEAERLWGYPVTTADEAGRCALALRDLGPRAVLVTGGHLKEKGVIVDTLADERGLTTWRHPRHPGPVPHGTGCALSAAVTAHLALGATLRESVRRALTYVATAVRTAASPGEGRPILGDGTTETVEPFAGEVR
jgi:hydroxymethylpyrimidine kinase/phosphomethylpyrimidine kinase